MLRMLNNEEEVYMLEDPTLQLEQTNIQHAIIGEPMTSLSEILLSLTKTRLSALASVHSITGRSKMKKEELAEALSDYVTNTEHLSSMLLQMDGAEWSLFETLLQESSVQDNTIPYGDYAFLLDRGLVFSFFSEGQLHLIMPEEIRDAIRKADLPALKQQHGQHQLAYQYIVAASHLYGAVKVDKLLEIYNDQNEQALSAEELLNEVNEAIGRGENLLLHSGYIVNSYLLHDLDEQKINDWIAKVEGKPYYVPEQEELLRYADETYFEMTPQLSALQQYVLRELCKDQETVEYLIDDLQLACAKGSSIQDLIYEFESRKINFKNPLQAQQTIQLLTEVYNHTRMWANNGHTLVELQAIADGVKPELVKLVNISAADTVPKVGRNEPCPCGSGLKYKKCHGK